ncbi:MAG: Smr/MutS family protein [Alphaproteobacteria bacterium]
MPDGAHRRRRRRSVTEDESRLWHEATRDVRRLAPPAPAPHATTPLATPATAALVATALAAERPIMGKARPLPVPPPLPQPVAPGRAAVAGLDRRSVTRLRRGGMPVEGRLDLHGLTQEEAHLAVNGFLASQRAAGRRVVLIITGRGFTPGRGEGERGGVLRRSLPRWLHEGANRERVLAYAPAQARHGGAGAFYVLLRRRGVQD